VTQVDQGAADRVASIATLEKFARFGVDLGLERIEHLLAQLDNPQAQVPLIHVAGTNGKGSVCAYLSAVLTAAGYRVGRYTSPHLVDWRERICVNQQPITWSELRSHLNVITAAINPSQPSPTQFEVITAVAWRHFAQAEVDVAVMEVGLGGRLDATNVCPNPLVSVITSIGRDHWQRLGPTLAAIATEKAGILKPGRPAVVGPLPAEAQAVVAQRVEQLACPVTWVTPATPQPDPAWANWGGIDFPLTLLGPHQLSNAGVAIAALQQLQAQNWAIDSAAIRQGMAAAQWPGRLQWVTWGSQPLLIDGAHNTDAAHTLRAYLDQQYPNQPLTWVMGMLATKDHRDIFTALLRPGDRLHLVPVPGHLTATPTALAALARDSCPDLAITLHPNLGAALAAAVSDPSPTTARVLCGSLYLVGHFLSQFGAASPPDSRQP
jgi:dihydrofolate synthase/folylpolyglutamate synthase